MWWALDVLYEEQRCVVGGVGVDDLTSATGVEDVLVVDGPPAPYVPGRFYERELPLLLRFLETKSVAGVVIDGFVWLGENRPGLGHFVHTALDVPVIGVAKNPFVGAREVATPVLRGDSTRPLWVTSIGVQDAAADVQHMHGPWRMPTLLKRADRLGREVG